MSDKTPAKPAPAQNVGHRFQDGHWRCGKCRYEWMPRYPGRDPKKCPRCYAWLMALQRNDERD